MTLVSKTGNLITIGDKFWDIKDYNEAIESYREASINRTELTSLKIDTLSDVADKLLSRDSHSLAIKYLSCILKSQELEKRDELVDKIFKIGVRLLRDNENQTALKYFGAVHRNIDYLKTVDRKILLQVGYLLSQSKNEKQAYNYFFSVLKQENENHNANKISGPSVYLQPGYANYRVGIILLYGPNYFGVPSSKYKTTPEQEAFALKQLVIAEMIGKDRLPFVGVNTLAKMALNAHFVDREMELQAFRNKCYVELA